MSVPEQNMQTLMGWLSDDATGAVSGADQVTEDLATLVFRGDREWPDHQDQAAGYADDISAWLDGDTESQFITLTAESGDLAAFISWMTPVLEQWKAPAAPDEEGQEGQGLANPNYDSDPTPGTEYYRYDEATGDYLYAATADGSAGWAAYDQRRYSDLTWDDNYGLSYRYDKRDEVYEWYDEPNGTWNDQAWADQYAASGRVAGVCSSTILKITVKGTARTMPTKPQSRLQKARPINTISGLRPSALPVIVGSIRLAVML